MGHSCRAPRSEGAHRRAEANAEQEKAIALEPANSLWAYIYAKRLEQAFNYEAAEKQIEVLIKQSPKNVFLKEWLIKDQKAQKKKTKKLPKDMVASEAERLFDSAIESIATQNWVQAEARLAKALSHSSDSLQIHLALAWLWRREIRWPEAEGEFLSAMRLDPNNPEWQNDLGDILLHQRRIPQAEQAFRQAVLLAPTKAAYHDNLGTVLLEALKLREAVAAYQEALRLDPNNASYEEHLKRATSPKNT